MKRRLSFWSWFSIYCLLALCWAGLAFAADTGAASTPAKEAKPAAKAPTKPASKSTSAAHKAGARPAAKPSAKAAKPAKKDDSGINEDSPWALRNHYTSSIDDSKLYYADDNADLALEFTDVGMVVTHTGFKITFADGHSITSADLGRGFSFREPFETAFGKGTRYAVDFPEKDGMKIHHSIAIHNGRPFVMVRLEIENTGTTPLEISSITPVVIAPGRLTNLGDDIETSQRHVVFHGPFPTYDKKASSVLAMIHDRTHKRTLAFGILPQGIAGASVDVDTSGAAKHVEIGSTFSPSLQVAPGQKLAADPVWFCYRVADPAKIDMFYSWARSTMPHSKDADKSPDSWVTVDPAAGADKLYAAAKEWSAAGVKHALVPSGWEGKPGTLQGAPGLYPKDMAKVAKELISQSVVPGITLDPLCSEDGENEWSTRGQEGPVWLNLSNPKGKEHAIARLKPIVSAGFAFYAVAPSAIPDAALKLFNMTRIQAETLAYEVMDAAANGAPIVAPSTAVMGSEMGPWLEAAAATSRMREYGVVSGAVRIDGASFKNADESLAAAITLYGGPIEVYGTPSGETLRQLASVFPRPAITGRPLDAATTAPKLWQVHVPESDEGRLGDAVIMFPGSPAWNLSDMDRDDKTPVKLWRTDNGEFLDSAKQIPAADHLTVLGVTPELNRPTIMGSSGRLDLLLSDLLSLTWDENGGILKGQFAGHNRKAATAYVFVPAGWSFKSGSAGKTKIASSKGNSLVEIPVETGSATRFELAFLKK